MLEIIEKKYPGKATLRPNEVSSLLGLDRRTVISSIKRRYSPLPARNVSAGIKNQVYVIPVSELIKWLLNRK